MDLAEQFLNLATKTGEMAKMLDELPESPEQQRLVQHFQRLEGECHALIPKLPVMPEIKEEAAEPEEPPAPPPPAPAAPLVKHPPLTEDRIQRAIQQLLREFRTRAGRAVSAGTAWQPFLLDQEVTLQPTKIPPLSGVRNAGPANNSLTPTLRRQRRRGRQPLCLRFEVPGRRFRGRLVRAWHRSGKGVHAQGRTKAVGAKACRLGWWHEIRLRQDSETEPPQDTGVRWYSFSRRRCFSVSSRRSLASA